MIKKLMQEYGLREEVANKIFNETQSHILNEIEANGWRIVPVRPTFRSLRMAYGYFAEHTWHYAKVWAVMVRMMPLYKGHALPDTKEIYKDLEKSHAIDQEYAGYLEQTNVKG